MLLSNKSFLSILERNLLSDTWYPSISLYSVCYIFILLIFPFLYLSFLVWYSPSCLFCFITYAFGLKSRKSLPWPMSIFFPHAVKGLTLKTLSHFILLLCMLCLCSISGFSLLLYWCMSIIMPVYIV
jgi:hypothetical protein